MNVKQLGIKLSEKAASVACVLINPVPQKVEISMALRTTCISPRMDSYSHRISGDLRVYLIRPY